PDVLIALADDTPPTDVVLNVPVISVTKVTLTWQAAIDEQSGVTNYLIYRDGVSSPTTLLATVGKITEYVEETYSENQTFFYRVKARNTAGILSVNYSNEVSASTGADVNKPEVSYVSSGNDSSTVFVEFSERVDKTTAETMANYAVDKSVEVVSAKLALDQRQVILTTSPLVDTTYTLTVKNVKDKAITPNTILESSPIFRHQNLSANIVASYSLEEIKVVGTDSLIVDASANANNGVAKNGPAISEGYLGNALKFDGVDDYVQFQVSSSFDLPGGVVSLSVWTVLNYLPADLPATFGPIFDSETDNYVIYEDKGNNQLRFKAATSGGAARPGINAADLKTGEWLHIVGVYDGTNAKIYMNGILKSTLPLTGTVNKGQVATLGKSGTSFFSGKIDNVQIFKKALTYQEVSDLYANTKTAVNITAVEDEDINLREFNLNQNYPNPFNPETKLSYQLPVSGRVSLKVFDILGREVATLVDEVKEAGTYDVSFSGKAFASGAYFYKFQSGNYVKIKKMILLK
ncbi:MAG: LamG-like jellyroll fold domain-containing protein, partial [Ignavibacteriaceae bacterium]